MGGANDRKTLRGTVAGATGGGASYPTRFRVAKTTVRLLLRPRVLEAAKTPALEDLRGNGTRGFGELQLNWGCAGAWVGQ